MLLHSAILFDRKLCISVFYSSLYLKFIILRFRVFLYFLLDLIASYRRPPGYTMLCYAMLCYAILYYNILYYTILYYTTRYYYRTPPRRTPPACTAPGSPPRPSDETQHIITCVYAYIYIYVCVYIYINTCVYIDIYIYIYIHVCV